MNDEILKIARYQSWNVKFGHRIMEAVGLFDYEMPNFIPNSFNWANKWIKGVVF